MTGRFFHTLSTGRSWQRTSARFAHAPSGVLAWANWHDTRRPHLALRYPSPADETGFLQRLN
jgi:hypothetical protein